MNTKEFHMGAHEYQPTPGPWMYEPADENGWAFNIMTTTDEESPTFYRVAKTTDGGPQAEVNARLIAAAPAMRDALRAIDDLYDMAISGPIDMPRLLQAMNYCRGALIYAGCR